VYGRLRPLQAPIGGHEGEQLSPKRPMARIYLVRNVGSLPVELEELNLPVDALGDRQHSFSQNRKINSEFLANSIQKLGSHTGTPRMTKDVG
ncbi:MAG TPA: hypothetical protein VFL31_02400, partial [Nitrospiraceae bacterium]|nr:hypothetical protein [Nitrospiraceae bacterium]